LKCECTPLFSRVTRRLARVLDRYEPADGLLVSAHGQSSWVGALTAAAGVP
jgi:hypothetical protein